MEELEKTLKNENQSINVVNFTLDNNQITDKSSNFVYNALHDDLRIEIN